MIDDMKGINKNFTIEASELLDNITDDIFDFEIEQDSKTINRIYKAFHTIKGNASMLGFQNLSFFSHRSEDMLARIRDRDIPFDKEIGDTLFQIIDTMKLILGDIQANENDNRDVKNITELLDNILENKKTESASIPKIKKEVNIKLNEKEEVIKEKKTLRILIVEDEFLSRNVLLNILSKYGDCEIAIDGLEAIEAYLQSIEENTFNPYDLIFMDIRMPTTDGMKASQKIRKIEKERGLMGTRLETKIIMTSVPDDVKTVIKSYYQCEADYYLIKPIKAKVIENQLKNLKLI